EIEPLFHPGRHAISPFSRHLIRMIRDDRSRVLGSRPSPGSEVVMDHQVEYSWRRDFSVVDLDLVGLRHSQRGHRDETGHDQQRGTYIHFSTGLSVFVNHLLKEPPASLSSPTALQRDPRPKM